jgi:hypothetical protein
LNISENSHDEHQVQRISIGFSHPNFPSSRRQEKSLSNLPDELWAVDSGTPSRGLESGRYFDNAFQMESPDFTWNTPARFHLFRKNPFFDRGWNLEFQKQQSSPEL